MQKNRADCEIYSIGLFLYKHIPNQSSRYFCVLLTKCKTYGKIWIIWGGSMHECLLCKRDMKKSKTTFGSGCINNIFDFLDMEKPKRVKDKEALLYKNIMKRTNMVKMNQNQKIWLTDRYLTHQYLDRLHYGNFNKLKNEINKEIQSINRAKKIEELKTMRKIKLKEAYDLYQKERRFSDSLNKIKNEEYSDDKDVKRLIASVGFIFNMIRNKNQYEKNSFKAMQYAFWQTVIEVGGNYAKFDIAADFLQHSLEKKPENLLITEGKVIEEIKKDKQFKENINSIVKKYGKDCNEFLFNSDIDKDFSMSFANNDLYFAINKISMKVKGKKHSGKWNLEIKMHDKYDYSEFKKVKKYYNDTNNVPKSIFSSTIYNLAYYSVQFGVMKEYDIDIQFEIKDFEVI